MHDMNGMKRFSIWGILLQFCLFYFACGKKYEQLEPGSTKLVRVQIITDNGQPQTVNCLYSIPDNYTTDKSWPLLVALHGDGSNAAAFHDLWQNAATQAGFILLTPQGERQGDSHLSWFWGKNAKHAIQGCIDMMQEIAPIDEKRISFVGFSRGGMVTYEIALQAPHILHSFAALGAPFRDVWLNESTKRAKAMGAFKSLRIYIGHGDLEENLDRDARHAANVFRGLGAQVHFNIYENTGHALPEPMEVEVEKIVKFLIAN